MVLGRELALSPLVLVDAVDEAGARLAPAESELAARFKHPKRRSEWILGRLAAKAALVRALAARGETVAPEDLAVLVGPDGAPEPFRVRGSDREPLDIGLSVTHGHGLGAAWALEGGLPGIDLERVRERPEGTFRFYLDADERAPLAALEGPARDRAAVLLWSLKEAAWKTLRPHRGVGLVDFEVLGVELAANAGSVRVTPRKAGVELARERGVVALEARWRIEGDLVFAWARDVS
jgi:4'-phosphopantetheinyl transferase EntD